MFYNPATALPYTPPNPSTCRHRVCSITHVESTLKLGYDRQDLTTTTFLRCEGCHASLQTRVTSLVAPVPVT